MIIMSIIMIFFILIPILTLPLSRVQECQRQLEFRLVLASILWISRMNDPSVQEPPIRDDTQSCLCQNVEFSENTLLVEEGHRALDGRCLLWLRILNCAEFPSLDHAFVEPGFPLYYGLFLVGNGHLHPQVISLFQNF